MPILIREVRPNYTEEALRQKIQGEVLLEVVISRDGRVSDARVIRSLDPRLDLKALEAVRQWSFVPGELRGEPVDVLAWVAVKFQII
jgi:TonB family protein